MAKYMRMFWENMQIAPFEHYVRFQAQALCTSNKILEYQLVFYLKLVKNKESIKRNLDSLVFCI